MVRTDMTKNCTNAFMGRPWPTLAPYQDGYYSDEDHRTSIVNSVGRLLHIQHFNITGTS
jgi:hypothetical protein